VEAGQAHDRLPVFRRAQDGRGAAGGHRGDLSPAEKRFIAVVPTPWRPMDKVRGLGRSGETSGTSTGCAVETDNRSVLIHEYAHVMQMDVPATRGPCVQGRDGAAAAFTTVPQALNDTDRLAVTSYMSCNNSLPSLRSLNDTWRRWSPSTRSWPTDELLRGEATGR